MPDTPFHEDCEQDKHEFCGCSWCYVHSDCAAGKKSKVFKGSFWSECHSPADKQLAKSKTAGPRTPKEGELLDPLDSEPAALSDFKLEDSFACQIKVEEYESKPLKPLFDSDTKVEELESKPLKPEPEPKTDLAVIE